jgi:hypothetical protein
LGSSGSSRENCRSLNQNTSLIEALLFESFESLFGLIVNPLYGSGA